MTDQDTSRALESDQRLAAHLRALSRLAPTTAHDIRTPLHTVVLYLELLRSTLAEPSGGDVRGRQERYVEVIGSELQRLEGMLDSFLDQLRVTEDSAERFDLVETVRDLGILLDPYCRRGRVALRRGSPDGPVVVEGNKDSLKQALLNILITSVEAIPADSELSLSVSAENGGAVVRIAGALPAIPSALLPGNDASDTTETERGLRVARRVVERHGGSINPRTGTPDAATLEIRLPLAAAKIG